MKLSTIRLITTNVKGSDSFLRQIFNLKVIEEQETFISYQLGELIIDLILEDQKNPSSSGGAIAYFLTDNLHLIINRAKELGAEVYRGPLRVTEINKEIVQIRDPYGVILGLEQQI